VGVVVGGTLSVMSRIVSIRFIRQDGVQTFVVIAPSQPVVVGRDTACDVRLDGRKVSRRHCRFETTQNGLVLFDLGSHNGTYVNGKKIDEVPIGHGDLIGCGEWEGRLEVREAAGVGAPMVDEHFNERTSDSISLDLHAAIASTDVPDLTAPRSVRMTLSADSKKSHEAPAAPAAHAAHALAALAQAQRKPSTTGIVLPPHLMAPQVHNSGVEWDDRSGAQHSELRTARVDETPLVRRMRETSTTLDFRGLAELRDMDAASIAGVNSKAAVDAVALRLVLRVTEALQGAGSLDEFLREMSQSLQVAARARAVVVLLPGVNDRGLQGMWPQVIQQRPGDERVHLSRTIIDHAVRNRMAVASEDAAADERFSRGDSVLRFDLKAVMCVPLVKEVGTDVAGALYLTRDLPFSNTERDAVAGLAHLITMGLERFRLREQVATAERTRASLERFHTPDVVRRLMMESGETHGVRDGLFLEPLIATVVFCDLSGFTHFCEHHEPAAVGTLLNSYLATMSEVVFAHGGTVDKFIGDAVMCIFGAPFSAADDAVRAVKCAQAMRRQFRSLVASGALGEPAKKLDVHIGINTGPVMAGTVGSARRMEYTALGDTVNIAARLESIAKTGQIVLGGATASAVSHVIHVRSLGSTVLRGKNQPQELFELPEDNHTEEASPTC
jgi:adenylate cyclase